MIRSYGRFPTRDVPHALDAAPPRQTHVASFGRGHVAQHDENGTLHIYNTGLEGSPPEAGDGSPMWTSMPYDPKRAADKRIRTLADINAANKVFRWAT